MGAVYYARTVVGCHVEKHELWTEVDTGTVVCKHRHEVSVPSRFCPSCGNPTLAVIERRPTALLSVLANNEVDMSNEDEFHDWWADQGHDDIMKLSVGDMSPQASHDTKNNFIVIGILIGSQSEYRSGREVSVSELQNAVDQMSELSLKHLNNRPVKVYTSLYCSC